MLTAMLAAVLLGALMAPANSEDAAPGANDAGTVGSPAKESGSHQGPKNDDIKGAIVPAPNAGDKSKGAVVDPIDTRISGRPGITKPKLGNEKTIVQSDKRANSRDLPGAIGSSARNAIGLPITSAVGAGGPHVAPQAPSPAAQISQPGALGGAATNPVATLANSPANAGGAKFAPQGAGLIAPATGMNRATINGTGQTRPGSGPGMIRGSAKLAVGTIGGSSFRPKY
jgi:hypothetical protein